MTTATVHQLKPAKLKPTPEWKVIGPAEAAALLEGNTSNRALSQVLIDRYEREMRNGTWDEDNGETIKVAADGTIIDGQHRLWAVVESGKTLRFLVVLNVGKDSFKTVDIGKARTPGDIAGIAGVPNPNNITAAASVVMGYRKKKLSLNRTFHFSREFTRSEMLDYVLANKDGFVDSVRSATQGGACKLMSASSLTALHYLFKTVSKAPRCGEQADAFFKQLGSGIYDDRFPAERHPIRTLREKLIANKQSVTRMSTGTMIALVIKSWNAYVAHRSVGVLRITQGETYPVIA